MPSNQQIRCALVRDDLARNILASILHNNIMRMSLIVVMLRESTVTGVLRDKQ